MDGFLLLLSFLLMIIGVAVAVFAAFEFYSIAKMKGHDNPKYFWWSFLLGPVGWMMVIALPNCENILTNFTEKQQYH